jgi:plastocyanin
MRWFLASLGLTTALVLTGCGGSSGSQGAAGSHASAGSQASASNSADTIVIKNFMFSPAHLTVPPGATVHIHNEDSVTHTLTDKSDPGLFSTGDIPAGQTKAIKAPGKAGSYSYICMIHQFMTGTLVVS